MRAQFSELIRVFTLADIILIVILISIALGLTLIFYRNSQNKIAEIYYQDKLMGSYKLDKDEKIEIAEGIIVEIKDGKARLAKDTSPLQIGVKQGWSDTIPIISVPSKLIIRFKNRKKQNMIITY